jgi:hypothetical protein
MELVRAMRRLRATRPQDRFRVIHHPFCGHVVQVWQFEWLTLMNTKELISKYGDAVARLGALESQDRLA